eukprot:6197774-Pleurochrysis_carterae.AAC.2
MKKFIEACNEDVFAVFMINIADTTLKNRLRLDYKTDAQGAWMYIEHIHEVRGKDICITKASDEQKALVEEEMVYSTEAAALAMVEKLL